MSEWIKTEDKLPEPYTDVLWHINGKYMVGCIDDEGSVIAYPPKYYYNDEITNSSWMHILKENDNDKHRT